MTDEVEFDFRSADITVNETHQHIFVMGSVPFNDIDEFCDAMRQARDETLRKIEEQRHPPEVITALSASRVHSEAIIDRLTSAGYQIVRKDQP